MKIPSLKFAHIIVFMYIELVIILPMQKDPAVLFYTQDFITGTLLMTDEQRGKYILLLCLQHQNGYLTEKDMLKICKTYDEDIWLKFQKVEDKYYNRRMVLESQKRKNYSDSRRKNREGNKEDMSNICESYVEHMENENEDSKEDKREDTKKGEKKKFIPPIEAEVIAYFLSKGYKAETAKKAFLYYTEMNWHDSRGSPIKSWKGKMVAVWFKDENKTFSLKELNDERNRHKR